MEKLKITLELLNGSAVILGTFLLVWLSFYIIDRYREEQMTMWSILCGVSGSISLAIYLYIEQTGIILTRAVIWNWRVAGARYPLSHIQDLFFAFGGFLISLGILLIIRLLSRPRFGEWPWVVAAITTFSYIVVRALMYLT